MKKFYALLLLILSVSVSFAQAEEYKPDRWDELAKVVHYSVKQEGEIKGMLSRERHRILRARSEAAEKVLKILKPQQRSRWDSLYRSADREGGYVGNFKKRQLINPVYLSRVFTLDGDQSRFLYYIFWDYSRQVERIRTDTRQGLERTLSGFQMNQWDRAMNRRVDQEAARQEQKRVEKLMEDKE